MRFALIVLTIMLASEPVDFTLKNLDGEMVSIKDYRGKTVHLFFWSMHCPKCKQDLKKLSEYYEKHPDCNFFAVNVKLNESDNQIRELKKEFDLKFPILLDEEQKVTLNVFHILFIPNNIFLDKNGYVSKSVRYLSDDFWK